MLFIINESLKKSLNHIVIYMLDKYFSSLVLILQSTYRGMQIMKFTAVHVYSIADYDTAYKHKLVHHSIMVNQKTVSK